MTRFVKLTSASTDAGTALFVNLSNVQHIVWDDASKTSLIYVVGGDRIALRVSETPEKILGRDS